MKYPPGPRTTAKRAREAKRKELPYTLVHKEIHGVMMWVKVYVPAYGEKPSTNSHWKHSEKTGANLENSQAKSLKKFPGKSGE